MERVVVRGLIGIVGVGIAAAGAVVLLTRQPAATSPESTLTSSPDAIAPDEQSIPAAPAPGPQQPPFIQLPPGDVARDLTAVLLPCEDSNPAGSGNYAVLNLELQASEGGGLVVVDVDVVRRDAASEAVLLCARKRLLARRLAVGTFRSGERFLTRYDWAAQPLQREAAADSLVADPLPEPRPESLPVSRQQLPRRGISR